MTTVEINAPRIFEDARRMRDAALERMAAGDVRDAAEKAWCATVRATEALVLARTGQEPAEPITAERRLVTLSINDQSLWELRLRYSERRAVIYEEYLCHEWHHPVEMERLIRETADFVRDAERLAQG